MRRTGAKGSVLPLLVGLGLDEISMGAPSIPAAKARMAQLDSRACRQLLNQAMACRTSLEVEHLLAQFRMSQQDAPLVTAQCITLDSDWRSKEEVIKGMTDNLLLAGRCRYPRKLEADLWAREAVFSTGLGFSFAIPHSKSEHIEQSTISVARLNAPVRWGDDEAQFIIMLTLNKHAAGDQHMRIFSRPPAASCTKNSATRWLTPLPPTLSPACCNMNLNCKGKTMELYLDTANVAEVERLARIFPIAGVTTNPSIVAASKESIWDVLPSCKTPSAKKALYLRRP